MNPEGNPFRQGGLHKHPSPTGGGATAITTTITINDYYYYFSLLLLLLTTTITIPKLSKYKEIRMGITIQLLLLLIL